MNIDLYENQYTEEELTKHITTLNLRMVLCTQKLSANFCNNYILNKTYQISDEEKNIDISDILNNQTHLKLDKKKMILYE